MADLSKIKVGGTTYNIKDEAARSDITELSSQISDLDDDVTALETAEGQTRGMISDAWVQRTWNPGEYCIDNNILWKCLVANSQRPSEGENWTAVSVVEEITRLNGRVTAEDYAECTTRDGQNVPYWGSINSNFLRTGYFSVFRIGKQVHFYVSGRTNKTSKDWIINLSNNIRPYAFPNFAYYLGDTQKRGWIDNTGNIFFNELNTNDFLSAEIVWNIA